MAAGGVEAAAAGWEPPLPSLVYRAGPIASVLEPLLLSLQPAGPLEEGLSLFFRKPLTISPSWPSPRPMHTPSTAPHASG